MHPSVSKPALLRREFSVSNRFNEEDSVTAIASTMGKDDGAFHGYSPLFMILIWPNNRGDGFKFVRHDVSPLSNVSRRHREGRSGLPT